MPTRSDCLTPKISFTVNFEFIRNTTLMIFVLVARLHVIQVQRVAVKTDHIEIHHGALQNQPHGHFQFLLRWLSHASLEGRHRMIHIHLQTFDLVLVVEWQDSKHKLVEMVLVTGVELVLKVLVVKLLALVNVIEMANHLYN